MKDFENVEIYRIDRYECLDESCKFIVISISDSVLTYFQNYHNVMTGLERQESKYYLIVKTQSIHIPVSIVNHFDKWQLWILANLHSTIH